MKHVGPWRNTPVKTLLVDLDGTLLASRDFTLRVEFITRVLWRLTKMGGIRAAFRALRATGRAVEHPALHEVALTNSERAARAFAREMKVSNEDGDRCVREVVGGVFPLLQRHFYPVPGAAEFLQWARPRYRLILATNPVWPLEQVKLRLKWAGIDPNIFESITHAGRMHACKPTLEYYRELLGQESLVASECALIGDDLKKDLPAVKAGISVFILSPREQDLMFEGAEARGMGGTFAHLTALLSRLSEHPSLCDSTEVHSK